MERNPNDDPLARMMRSKEEQQLDEIAAGQRTDAETEGFEIVGDGEQGGERVLCHMIIDPRLAKNARLLAGLDDNQIREQMREGLEKHCMSIGWWPDGEGPDFVIGKREDGVWHGWAKLRESRTMGRSKAWSDFPKINVDGRTQHDILKNASSTTF